MGDADLTYDFGEIPRFLEQLDAGADLVMGDRMDDLQPGAMPAAPLRRQPDLKWHAQLLVSNRCARRPLRHAGGPPVDAASTCLERNGYGVRQRDGCWGRQEKLDIRQFPIDTIRVR